MTPEQINRLMAEKVMGFSIIGRSTRWWLRTENWDELTNFSSIPDNPVYFDPYHRIEHAMMALEKFNNKFHSIQIGNAYFEDTDWWCKIDEHLGYAHTLTTAICLACIEAGVSDERIRNDR